MAYPQQQYYAPYPQQQYYTPNNGAAVDMLNQYKYGQPQPMPMQQPMQQMPQPMPSPQMQMQQPMAQQNTIQSHPFDDRVWVQGDAGAKAFLVAPGATVILWDTESPRIYIKRADSTGKPLDMEIIDYTVRNSNAPKKASEHECHCAGKYAPIDEFNALREKMDALRAEFDEYKKGGAE